MTIALGPPEHGVTRFAVDSARAAGTPLLEVPHVAALQEESGAGTLAPGTPLHLHITDHLFGDTPEDAASVVEALARDHPVAVTLHDVPQPAEGAERCAHRAAAYRRIAQAAGLVVVSSVHERRLCEAIGVVADVVIPLPVPALGVAPADEPAVQPDLRSVGVFGFLHPGKAVDVVADAVAALAAAGDHDISLRLLGRPADGHEEYVAAALESVRAAGVHAELTGRIPEAELRRVLAQVTVPVALFRNVSASGSLNTWAAAGRRPLVLDSDYIREVDRSHPGSVLITDGADLAGDLCRLLDDPAPTRREIPPSDLAELGAAYRAAWAGWLR